MAWTNGTPAGYARWKNIYDRCTKQRCKDWPRYGGRGITLHPQWMDYKVFIADVGQPPFPGATLDRIDNDRGYEPGNIRWIPKGRQAFNMRSNVRVEIGGVSKLWSEWATDLGTCAQVMNYRLKVLGSREAAIRSITELPPTPGKYRLRKYAKSWGL
jgi:hypothetical protein